MTITTSRGRPEATDRSVARPRGARTGRLVDGANALQVDYAERGAGSRERIAGGRRTDARRTDARRADARRADARRADARRADARRADVSRVVTDATGWSRTGLRERAGGDRERIAGGRPVGEPFARPTRRVERISRAVAPTSAGEAAPIAPPAPVALPRARFLVLVVAVVVVAVVGVLLLNTKINENAFRIDSLREQQAALDQQEQALAQRLAQREAPGELRAAAARLGLVPAGTPAFINLPDGRVVGVPQPATASAGR